MSSTAVSVNVTGPGLLEHRAAGSKVEQAGLYASDATCAAAVRTRPVPAGTVLVAAEDVPVLRFLLREGVRTVRARGRVPTQVLEVVRAFEQATGSEAGTAAGGSVAEPEASSVTVDRTAEVLNVSPGYVRRLCRTGELAAQRHGHAWLIDADALAAYRLRRRS